jgi:hypothetical protein
MVPISRGLSRRNLIRSLVGGSLLMPGILTHLLTADGAETQGHRSFRTKEAAFQS